MSSGNIIETDVLVIGGGMSGLFAAIKAREEGVSVTLVDKNYISRSGSTVFSNFLSLFNPEWGHEIKSWLSYINVSSEYINNPEWTEVVLRESYERYKDLMSWGIELRRKADGEFELIRMPQSPIETRMLQRGITFLPNMRQKAAECGVMILDRVMIIDLVNQEGRVIGALGFHTPSGDLYTIRARATVVCTGGGNFNPVRGLLASYLTYDGEAMAYRAGTEIGGKEFVLSGATISSGSKDEETRISLNGVSVDMTHSKYPVWATSSPHTGGIDALVDAEGYAVNRFTAVHAIHEGRGPLLANLNAVSPERVQTVLREIRESGNAFRLERVGIDITRGGLWSGMCRFEGEVGCGVHGGGAGISSIDFQCATKLPGLYAAGDACHSGMLGARYTFGLGLSHAMVTGDRAGRAAADYASKSEKPKMERRILSSLKNRLYAPIDRTGGFDSRWVTQQLQYLIFPYYICHVRHEDRLMATLTLVDFLKNHIGPKLVAKDPHGLRYAHEIKNMMLSTEMMLKSAIFRTESRGTHYREDYPRRDDPGWLAWVKLKNQKGEMETIKEPLPKKWWPDLSKSYATRYPMKFPGEG